MEHIRDVLKQARTSTSKASTDTLSDVRDDKSSRSEGSASTDCPVCQGAGVVHPLLSTGKPDYTHVVTCRCARKVLDKDRQSNLQKSSNLGLLSRLTFDSLSPQGRSGFTIDQEQFSRALNAARAYAARPAGWFVISGPSGSGKTHLAAAIANERLRLGYPAFYISTPDLLDHLRSAYSPTSDVPFDEFFNQVRNVPLLILDDLGAQTSTSWAKEKLDQLLTHRFNSELPTVIVTIVAIDQLEERIRTRLADPRLCQVFTLEQKQAVADYSGGLDLELIRSMTFKSFDYKRVNLPPEQRAYLEEAFQSALNFAQSPEGWLVLMGDTGTGKTHLAAAIANYNRQAGKPVLFIVVPEFLDHLRSTFSPESKVSYDQVFESVKTTPLLIFDDFGEHSTSPWAQEKLYQVINYRYNARLPTVITTRLSLEQMAGPIASRISDPKISKPFVINVPDYRSDVRSSLRRTSRGGRRGT